MCPSDTTCFDEALCNDKFEVARPYAVDKTLGWRSCDAINAEMRPLYDNTTYDAAMQHEKRGLIVYLRDCRLAQQILRKLLASESVACMEKMTMDDTLCDAPFLADLPTPDDVTDAQALFLRKAIGCLYVLALVDGERTWGGGDDDVLSMTTAREGQAYFCVVKWAHNYQDLSSDARRVYRSITVTLTARDGSCIDIVAISKAVGKSSQRFTQRRNVSVTEDQQRMLRMGVAVVTRRLLCGDTSFTLSMLEDSLLFEHASESPEHNATLEQHFVEWLRRTDEEHELENVANKDAVPFRVSFVKYVSGVCSLHQITVQFHTILVRYVGGVPDTVNSIVHLCANTIDINVGEHDPPQRDQLVQLALALKEVKDQV